MARTQKVQTNSVNVKDEQVQKVSEGEQVATVVDDEVDASGRKKKVTITHEELEEKGLKNKSQVIRFLDSEGFSRSAIALFLNVRYQHVRNVLITPLKKA